MTIAAGNKIYAVDVAMSTVTNRDDTSRTTTSTSFTSTLTAANICGISFTAPPSGKVLIDFNCDCDNSGAGFAAASIAVRTGSTVGSGTSVVAAAFALSVIAYGGVQVAIGRSHPVTGLVAGDVYNACFEHIVDSNTGTFRYREITVTGCLA